MSAHPILRIPYSLLPFNEALKSKLKKVVKVLIMFTPYEEFLLGNTNAKKERIRFDPENFFSPCEKLLGPKLQDQVFYFVVSSDTAIKLENYVKHYQIISPNELNKIQLNDKTDYGKVEILIMNSFQTLDLTRIHEFGVKVSLLLNPEWALSCSFFGGKSNRMPSFFSVELDIKSPGKVEVAKFIDESIEVELGKRQVTYLHETALIQIKNLSRDMEKNSIISNCESAETLLILGNSEAESITLLEKAKIKLSLGGMSIFCNYEINGCHFLRDINLKDISASSRVVVGQNPVGFWAVLLEKDVLAFGDNFYFGYGFTDDEKFIKRSCSPSRLEMFEVCCFRLIKYSEFFDDSAMGFLFDFFHLIYDLGERDQKESLINILDKNLVNNAQVFDPDKKVWKTFFVRLSRGKNAPKFKIILMVYLWGRLNDDGKKNLRKFIEGNKFKIEESEKVEFEKVFNSLDKYHVARWQSFPALFWRHYIRAEVLIQNGCYQEAFESLAILVALGRVDYRIISRLSKVCYQSFDFQSAALFMDDALLRLTSGNNSLILSAQYHALAKNYYESYQHFVKVLVEAPYMSSKFFEDSIAEIPYFLGDVPYIDIVANLLKNFDTDSSFNRVRGLLAINKAFEANLILDNLNPLPDEYPTFLLLKAKATRMLRRFEDSKKYYEEIRNLWPRSSKVRIEGIQLALDSNSSEEAMRLVHEAQADGIEIPEIYVRRSGKSLMSILDVFMSHREIKSKRHLRKYVGDKLTDNLPDFRNGGVSQEYKAVIPYFGPGDEIRYVVFYPDIVRFCSGQKIKFGCDPRLHELFSRSYPDLELVPVRRVRNLTWLENYNGVKGMPGADLFRHIDKRGWDLINESSKVIIQLDAISDVVKDYSYFSGESYLKPNPERVEFWRNKISGLRADGKKIVGLCWRSSLNSPSRSTGYMDVLDFVPVISLPGVEFVNLQYGKCQYDLERLENVLPGSLTNFREIDLFDDLDDLSALMNELDLVIAPPTTVAELAGAIGKKVVMFTSTEQYRWRLYPGSNDDVWHKSVFNVNCSDKAKLVDLVRDHVSSLLGLK